MKKDERFENIRTKILMMKKLPSISQVYRNLHQEETHKIMSRQSCTPGLNQQPSSPQKDKIKKILIMVNLLKETINTEKFSHQVAREITYVIIVRSQEYHIKML